MVRLNWKDIIKKEYTDEDTLRYDYLLEKFNSIEHEETKILCILLYLFGARIGEVCNYTQEKYVMKAKRYADDKIVTLDNGSVVTIKYAGEVVKVNGKTKYNKVLTKRCKLDGVTKSAFKFVFKEKNGKDYEFFQVTLRNEKNKSSKTKICFAPYWIEKDLIDQVVNYFKKFKDDEVVFKKDRRNYYYLHFLRSLRCCVLIFVYKFTEFDIMDFMGWSDTRPLKAYKFLISLLSGMYKMIGDKE